MIKLIPSRLKILHQTFRSVNTTTFLFTAKEKTDDKSSSSLTVDDVLKDLQEPEITEEELMRKRFKSRMPERIYRKFVLKEALPLENKYDFNKYRLRQHYARHGKDSELNPGICYPTRQEIEETIFYEKMFEPSLQERMRKVEEARLAEEKQKKDYEDEVDANMAQLDKWIADYRAREKAKQDKASELKKNRERLVEEISEYLGYDVDPKDPRFKEAVEQKEKEKKKAMKLKKQQESYDKMLDKLKKIAQSK